MSRRAYRSWLTVLLVLAAGYGGVQVVGGWPAPVWLNVPVILLGLFSLAQCCRWHWLRHRDYVSAKCSARAAADHARRNYS